MDLRDLKYFAASVEAGNFGRAARTLGLETSTLSRGISRLEDELGLALFERGRWGARLTSGGKAIVPYVRQVLADLDAMRHAGAQNGIGAEGAVRLGIRLPLAGSNLNDLLAAWRRDYPDVALSIAELDDHNLTAAMKARRLDAAVLLRPSLWPQAACVTLYRERLVAALPVGHALATREAVSWDDIGAGTVLVEGGKDNQSAQALFTSLLGPSARFSPQAVSRAALLSLVAAGFGVTLAGAGEATAGFSGVVFKEIADPDAEVEVVLAWLPEREDAAVGRFIAYWRDQARSGRLG